MPTEIRTRDRLTDGSPVLGIRPITDREFALFRDLIARESGIVLRPSKKALRA